MRIAEYKDGKMIYRDMAPEEVAEYEKAQAEMPKPSYGEKVEELIRERYTISDEIAILRQRDTKPEEFAEYNAFAEECKAKAKISII